MPQACANCSAQNDDGRTVCAECGERLDAIRPGQRIASRYEILGRLGRGGMGAVYRAYDRVLEEEVALKVLHEHSANRDDARRRFRTEIKLARRVMHRNVCRIYEYGEEGGHRFISMELVQGTELKRQAGTLSAEGAYGVAIQIADGLEAIHAVGIIHRDLKTSNIMLEPSGTVRLMDFGIAKHVAVEGAAATATGDIVGTPAYMSPEQARAEKLDFRSDVYALGVVLYELFTGRVPFEADTPIAVILKHIHDPPPLEGPGTEKLPPALVPILARALAKSRAARFQTAAEVGQALRAAAGETAAFPSGPGAAVVAMGGPTGPTLPWSAAAERAWQAPTEVPQPTQEVDGTVVDVPMPHDTMEATATRTVALPDRGRSPRARAPWPAVAITLALLAAILLWTRPWRLLSETEGTPSSAVSPSPASIASPAAVAAAKSVVTFNARPWARIKLLSRGSTDSMVPVAGELITPCTVDLADGDYTVELENGGLTPPLRREIKVGPGQSKDFVFTMPSFDPARAAQAAVERRP
jgi:predicted Ser/Thr protein kinase